MSRRCGIVLVHGSVEPLVCGGGHLLEHVAFVDSPLSSDAGRVLG